MPAELKSIVLSTAGSSYSFSIPEALEIDLPKYLQLRQRFAYAHRFQLKEQGGFSSQMFGPLLRICLRSSLVNPSQSYLVDNIILMARDFIESAEDRGKNLTLRLDIEESH